MKIPCETIARLAHLLPSPNEEIDPIFRSFRLDNGKIIVSDRKFMAIEHIGNWEGVFHIQLDDRTLEQCRSEAQFAGTMEVIPTPALNFTTAKTTMGYAPVGNIGVFPQGANTFDRWVDIVKQCAEPAAAPRGGMVWRCDAINALAMSSPSGIVVFEETIDVEQRPTIVRDINSPDWCGFYLPRLHDGMHHAAATLPGWLKV